MSRSADPTPQNICVACGLCCDGTIFGDVRLVPGDDPSLFRALGLPLLKVRGKSHGTKAGSGDGRRFPQPCRALAGRCCSIYASRPGHCRQFECFLLKKLQSNQITVAGALKTIRAAQAKARTVCRLLRSLGDLEEGAALGHRFRRTTRRLQTDPLDSKTAARYGRLTLAFHDLNLLIQESFYDNR